MKIFLRHLVLCALPVLFGAGAGYGFTFIRGSCGAMVGALFAEYQARFQLGGAAGGTLIAALLGTWLEHRRRRTVQETPSEGEPS
jgi:membrane associated rhomboid family serine protease